MNLLSRLRRTANSALLKVQRALGVSSVIGLGPVHLMIEPGVACNLRCPLCPTGAGQLKLSGESLPLERFQRILHRFESSLRRISLYHWGEPFLHPDIMEMVSIAEGMGINVSVSSNLNHFSPRTARQVVEAGLSELIVAIDGACQGTYAQYRRGGSLRRVFRHVRWILEEKTRQRKRHPELIWQFLAFRHNDGEIEQARKMARRLSMDFRLVVGIVGDRKEWRSGCPRLGETDFKKQKLAMDHCSSLWLGPVIHADGSVLPCCAVKDARYSFGNILREDFDGIWNNARFQAARKAVSSGIFTDSLDIPCRGCPYHPARLAGREVRNGE